VKCAVSSGGMLGIQRLMHYRAEGEQFWCIYLLTQRTFEGWLKGTDIVPSCLYPLRLHMRVMPAVDPPGHYDPSGGSPVNSRERWSAWSTFPGLPSHTWPGSGSGFMASGFRASTRVQVVGSPGCFEARCGGTSSPALTIR
jgi:hypothetical protein